MTLNLENRVRHSRPVQHLSYYQSRFSVRVFLATRKKLFFTRGAAHAAITSAGAPASAEGSIASIASTHCRALPRVLVSRHSAGARARESHVAFATNRPRKIRLGAGMSGELTPNGVPVEDPDVAKVLYSERAIADRVAALGVELAAEYADKAPVVLPVMTGAMCFCSDLLRAMRPSPRGTQVESIKSKSYFGNRSTGNVKVHPIEIDVEGRHVLLVEDIVDTGLTIAKLKEHAEQAGAASVKMVALLNKGARRVNDMQPEWTGFECEDEFVIGYGMDFDGAYRELPYIGVLKPEVYGDGESDEDIKTKAKKLKN